MTKRKEIEVTTPTPLEEIVVGGIIYHNGKAMKIVEVGENYTQVKALEFPFESFPIFERTKAND